MADKKKKNQNSKKTTKRAQSVKKPAKTEASTNVNGKSCIGYSARIKLPNGKIKVAAASGLWDSEECPSAIVIKTKEQAMIVAKNLATAYGKGARPSVRQVKKAAEKVKTKPAAKKINGKRYKAKQVNGKGYIFDSNFSANVPIAVEKTYATAAKLVDKYNKEA